MGAEIAAAEESLLVGVAEAVALTGIPKQSFLRLAGKGVVEKIRPAGMRRVFFRRQDLLDWVAKGCPGPERAYRRKR